MGVCRIFMCLCMCASTSVCLCVHVCMSLCVCEWSKFAFEMRSDYLLINNFTIFFHNKQNNTKVKSRYTYMISMTNKTNEFVRIMHNFSCFILQWSPATYAWLHLILIKFFSKIVSQMHNFKTTFFSQSCPIIV